MAKTWTPFERARVMRAGRAKHVAGSEAYGRGDYGEAIACFTCALEIDARNQFALCNRALARWRRGEDGDAAQALEDARACVRNAPTWHKAWFRLGQARAASGAEVEALSAYAEAIRCDECGQDRDECEAVMKKLRARVELDERKAAEAAEAEARRAVEVAEEDDEIERRRARREAKLEAKRARHKVAEERLSKQLGYPEGMNAVDVNAYADESDDSDDSALETYDACGRAMFIERKITDFVSIARRLRTSVGATKTMDMMCELRRYGCCQISLGAAVGATAKFKVAADAADRCALPYVVIPAWREASTPWPMSLAQSHQDVQDVMWLMETVARVTTGAIYEDAGKSEAELDRALDSPLSAGVLESAPSIDEVSLSALVFANDESFLRAYAEKNSALVRLDWLEAYEEEDAEADGDSTLVELFVGAELTRRLDDEFITVDELDPRDRDGHGPDGTSFACPRAKRPADRTRVSFFLCPKNSNSHF